MKLAIISGGSKGLGAQLCEQYQARGFEVIEFSRSASRAYSVAVDLASPIDTSRVVRAALTPLATRGWDEIVVISNAGTLTPTGPTSKKDIESVIANLNTNFVSAIVFITEVLRHFQPHTGRKTLASISSGAALGERAGWSLYCASKAGLEHGIRSIAREQESEEQPFRAINIDPGLMDTDMQSFIRQLSIEDFPSLEQFNQRQAAGQLVPPAMVAEAILGIIDSGAVGNGERIKVSIS